MRTRHNVLSTALAVLFGVGGLSLAMAVEPTQPALSKKELKAAIANAKTPQDHLRIAAYYKSEAGRLLTDAKEHDELAVVYATSPRKEAPIQTGDHCVLIAESARKAAQASRELAKLHEEMAKQAR